MRNNRQHRCNQDLRDRIYLQDIYIYEVGEVMGISRSVIYEWFDHPMSPQRRASVEDAIRKIGEERRLLQ